MGSHIDGLSFLALPFLNEMRAVSDVDSRRAVPDPWAFASVRVRASGGEFLTGNQADRHATGE
jgi:hypothetical protein